AGADQSGGVFGNIERLFQMGIVGVLSVAEFAQEIQGKLAKTGKAVGVLVEIPEHVIVLGAEIIIAPIFGEHERIEKQAIAVGGQIAEQGAASAAEGFLLDFAQKAEHLLSGASQNNLLAHPERGDQFL